MSLAFVGGSVIDVIFPGVKRIPQWPDHTEFTPNNLELLTQAPLVTIGGNGANAAFVAGRLGATALLHTNIGRDAFGGLARQWLESAGCRIISPPAHRTAVNVTANNRRMQRATYFYPGSTPVLPPKLPPSLGVSHAIVCGWPHPRTRILAPTLGRWKAAGIFTAYDAGPILGTPLATAELEEILSGLSLFLSNEHELCVLAGTATPSEALAWLRIRFAGHIVIKLGPKGCLWLAPGQARAKKIAGLRVRAVNTVGAGDTFNGALLAALAAGAAFSTALRFANRAAASVVSSGLGVLGLKPTKLPTK